MHNTAPNNFHWSVLGVVEAALKHQRKNWSGPWAEWIELEHLSKLVEKELKITKSHAEVEIKALANEGYIKLTEYSSKKQPLFAVSDVSSEVHPQVHADDLHFLIMDLALQNENTLAGEQLAETLAEEYRAELSQVNLAFDMIEDYEPVTVIRDKQDRVLKLTIVPGKAPKV